jgi:hypothetical protein
MRAPTALEQVGVQIAAFVVTKLVLALFTAGPERVDGVEAVRLTDCPSHPSGHDADEATRRWMKLYSADPHLLN